MQRQLMLTNIRQSMRLKEYDYFLPGLYFITICIKDNRPLLGNIVDGKMRLNKAGEMTKNIWEKIPKYYEGIEIDTFQIMPNHIHGIIIIVGVSSHACLYITKNGQPQGVAPTWLSLSDVVHRFKTLTTKRYIDGVKLKSWQPFHDKLWQRSFYDHVIRNEKSLEKIKEYIVNNSLFQKYM